MNKATIISYIRININRHIIFTVRWSHGPLGFPFKSWGALASSHCEYPLSIFDVIPTVSEHCWLIFFSFNTPGPSMFFAFLIREDHPRFIKGAARPLAFTYWIFYMNTRTIILIRLLLACVHCATFIINFYVMLLNTALCTRDCVWHVPDHCTLHNWQYMICSWPLHNGFSVVCTMLLTTALCTLGCIWHAPYQCIL